MLINGGNDFYAEFFKKMCKELEKGNEIDVYIDCIGHTRNNMTQEAYKTELQKKYGEKLDINKITGNFVYHYSYKLK